MTMLGRSEDCTISIDDLAASRRHARISETSKGFVLEDLKSGNGTYVNRERIDSVQLKAGDEVQVGKYRLTYHSSPRRNEL